MQKTHSYCLIMLAVICLLLSGMGVYWLRQPERFPIRTIKLYGDYQYLTQARLKAILTPYLEQHSFYSVSSGHIEKRLDALPVVKFAEVRRQWPDVLLVRVHTRAPVAVWNETSLVAENGEIFSGAPSPGWRYLPHFVGAKDQVKDMLHRYRLLSGILQSDHLYIKSFDQNEQGNVQLQLIPGGFWIYLGHRDILPRVQRFVQAYSVLSNRQPGEEIAYVDLRYRQGLAVRWTRAADV